MTSHSKLTDTARHSAAMPKERLTAFSDGVIAIIITITVLELKIPHGAGWDALRGLLPVFLSYVLSFLYVAIYWSNHHHLFQTVETVSGGILCANVGLLFWLSLVPFATGWMAENHFMPLPVALYGVVLLLSALGYFVLQIVIVRTHGHDSLLATALGKDIKGKLSLVLYVAGIACAFFQPWLGVAFYVVVALMWLVPDRRIERVMRG